MITLRMLFRLNLLICILVMLCSAIPACIHHFLDRENMKGRVICRILGIVLLTGGFIAFLACMGRNTYYDSMVRETSVETADSRYLPFFQGNSLSELGESPHLFLAEKQPVLEGSSTLLPFYASMVELIYPEAIMKKEGSACPFQYTQDSDLYYKLVQGQVDMIFTEQEPSARANLALKEEGLELKRTKIGQVAFVFFVNSSNEVENLSMSQIRSIYAGGVSNWRSLGGSDTEILAFQSEEDSCIRQYLQKLMGRLPLKKSLLSQNVDEDGELPASEVSYLNVPGAIGCTFSCYAHGFDVDKGVKLLRIEGISPAEEEGEWQEYCLMQPLYCVTIKNRENVNKKLIREWILSDQGQRLLTAAGYYPLSD